MYQKKQIIYKSIFINGDNKETVELKVEGKVYQGDTTIISFKTDDFLCELSYNDQHIILKNNQSQLRLVKNQRVKNLYKVPYGEVLLETKLLNFKFNENQLGIKYELYDNDYLISTVYITINMLSL
jgi:uncharacterized beta-barrel protein YwiB (DUF1934 family)